MLEKKIWLLSAVFIFWSVSSDAVLNILLWLGSSKLIDEFPNNYCKGDSSNFFTGVKSRKKFVCTRNHLPLKKCWSYAVVNMPILKNEEKGYCPDSASCIKLNHLEMCLVLLFVFWWNTFQTKHESCLFGAMLYKSRFLERIPHVEVRQMQNSGVRIPPFPWLFCCKEMLWRRWVFSVVFWWLSSRKKCAEHFLAGSYDARPNEITK